MKVALWGSYNHGNFGDDAMAILFARHLERRGYQPVVYRLDRSVAATEGIAVADGLDELLRDAAVLVLGGGGLLVGDLLLRRLVVSHARAFERDFTVLHDALRRRRIPAIAVSIGGDGRGIRTVLPAGRRALFSDPLLASASVRLRGDVDLLAALGRRAVHYPDVLLDIATLLPTTSVARKLGRARIGINLATKVAGGLRPMLLQLARANADCELVCIGSHLPSHGFTYEMTLEGDMPNVTQEHYRSPGQMMALLELLDVLISSKLHVGVTALSMGVPFLSFGGKGKTRGFLEQVGLADSILAPADEARLLSLIASPQALLRLRETTDFTGVEAQRALSHGHLDFLDAELARLGRSEAA